MAGIVKKVFLMVVLMIPFFMFAMPGAAGGDIPPCGEPFGEACIPIDGGISLLIAAGLAYGGKKAYDSRRKG